MTALALPPSVPAPAWLNATVRRFHDGDTFYVTAVVGKDARHVVLDQPIRLLGCNARELDDPTGGGRAAAAAVAAWPGITVGSQVALLGVDDDKYSPRWDASVAYTGPDGRVHDLVTDLVIAGWVAPWNGRGTAPVPPYPRQETRHLAAIAAVQRTIDVAVAGWRADTTRAA